MRFKLIFSIVGFMGILCGIAMMIPAFTDMFYGHYDAGQRFLISGALCVAIGLLIRLICGVREEPLRIKEMFLTTTLIWVFCALFCAIPFFVSVYKISLTDAVFEAMSGLTTTGATVLSGLDNMTPGILLWRSILQWVGGAGIVIVVITILPALRIGGMQFFTTESSAGSERDLPTVIQNMRAILVYFIGLTVLCAILLKWAGMTGFDSLNHAMTTISTGGFSTHDTSIGYFKNPTIEWIVMLFMFISGMPLILGLHLFKRRWRSIKEDSQILFYVKFIFLSVLLLTFLRWLSYRFAPVELMVYIREGLFAIVSVVTTTGFVSENYQIWGNFALAFFMFLLVVGGCTGSTTGGIKMFRFSVLSRASAVRLKTVVQPYGVFIPRYGSHTITDDVLISVLVFFGLYLGTAVIISLGLSAYGLDFVSALSASLTALSNVGPALGGLIGPDKTFALLPDGVKWLLTFAMLIGRLEFVSVFVLFFPFLWRRNV